MYKLIITVFCFVTILASCNTRTHSKLIKYESLFLNEFIDHSLLIRGDVIELQIYRNDLKNDYFFRKQDEGLKFMRDSIQFDISDLPKYGKINIDNKEEYSRQIEEVAWSFFRKMNEANIRSFTSEFRKFGIDLMVSTKDQKLVYVSDTLKVINPEWKMFLEQSNRIKSQWYLYNIPD